MMIFGFVGISFAAQRMRRQRRELPDAMNTFQVSGN